MPTATVHGMMIRHMNTSTEHIPTNLPDVTIVTVCYNALTHLAGCIASVVNQRNSGLNIEHLIIDGNSTDGTQAYLQQALEKGDITSYISDPDKGIYDAMNKGIARAKGKIIAFLNADDEFLPGAIAALSAPILEDKADYAMGTARVLENGAFTSRRWPDLDNAFMGAICCHQALFCKTHIMRDLGGFEGDTFPVIADGDFMAKLAAHSYTPAHIAGDHVIFREGGCSADCVVTSADQYIILIEKYWPYLLMKITQHPPMFQRVKHDIQHKITNLKKYTALHSGLDITILLGKLLRMQHDLMQFEKTEILSREIHQQQTHSEELQQTRSKLKKDYFRYRILAKICWGNKRKYYIKKKQLTKYQLKWHK